MVQSVAGGEGSVLSRDPSSVSDWWAHSWCCNCNIFPCSCYDINDSTFTQCRARISHRPGPGGSTGPPVVLHKVWFVCQDRPGSRLGWTLENCQSHVFGKQLACCVLCLVSSLHTPSPSSLLHPIQSDIDSRDVCCPSTTPWSLGLAGSVLCPISISATASFSIFPNV